MDTKTMKELGELVRSLAGDSRVLKATFGAVRACAASPCGSDHEMTHGALRQFVAALQAMRSHVAHACALADVPAKDGAP